MGVFSERIKVKACGGCGQVLTTVEFYRNASNPDGLDHYCKGCRLGYNRDWVREHPDRRYLTQWRYRTKVWWSDRGVDLRLTG